MGGGVKRLVGLGLLGVEGVQLGVMVTGLASSRASFAPTVLIAARRKFCACHKTPVCGLAREGGESGTLFSDGYAAFASKLRSYGDRLDPEPIAQCVIRGAHGGQRGLEGAAAEHGHVRQGREGIEAFGVAADHFRDQFAGQM